MRVLSSAIVDIGVPAPQYGPMLRRRQTDESIWRAHLAARYIDGHAWPHRLLGGVAGVRWRCRRDTNAWRHWHFLTDECWHDAARINAEEMMVWANFETLRAVDGQRESSAYICLHKQ